jgi:hypothetical protein
LIHSQILLIFLFLIEYVAHMSQNARYFLAQPLKVVECEFEELAAASPSLSSRGKAARRGASGKLEQML